MGSASSTLLDRLRDAVDLLESIAANRGLLSDVPDTDRRRLLQAIADVSRRDRVERRRMAKAVGRGRRAARTEQTERARAETGIRLLRKRQVFHTPNVFPPVPAG